LDAYATLLGSDNIQYNCKVTDATFDENLRLWNVTTESTEGTAKYTIPFLVVATGENVVPKIPKFTGEETFKGKIMHSVK
jgi:cation diffusion facilitator CzcD-associated flavoprotein CzcO